MMSTVSKGEEFDAVIIGAGHNGLVTAAYLAKAGLRVVVLERREVLGGAAATEEIFSGYQINTGTCDTSLLLPKIISDLDLETNGVEFIHPPAAIFAPQLDGRPLTIWRDPQRTREEIAAFSKKDADNFPGYLRLVSRLGEILRDTMTLTPPAIPEITFGSVLPWLPLALKVKRLGDHDLAELLRVVPMPVKDFLDEWFENPLLKAALGVSGVIGSMQGPRSPGTSLSLLYQANGAGSSGFPNTRLVRGGTGVLSQALADFARKHGADIHLGEPVEAINLDRGQITGVTLTSGERISSRIVLSNANPRHTFFDLVGAPNLPLHFVREMRDFKYRGSTTRINLVLSGFPSFNTASSDENLTGRIVICPNLDYLERAYDSAKYGSTPTQPYLDIVIPTLSDPSLAPEGAHIMCIDVRYTPYNLSDSTWDKQKERLGDQVIKLLSAYAPDIKDLVTHRQILTPLDLERHYGLPEGNIYHGQMGLDQLFFMRPSAGSHGANTPIPGLYVCGSGAHPGGGLTGAPGYNAARQMLKEMRKEISSRRKGKKPQTA